MHFALLFGLLSGFVLTSAENMDITIIRGNQSEPITPDIEKFSANLYQKETINEPENLVSSPFSTNVALAMLAFGAGGKTRQELKTVLGIEIGCGSKYQYKRIIDDLTIRNQSPEEVEIKVLSRIFINENIAVNPEFKNVTRDVFRKVERSLDCSKNENAAKSINSWIRSESNNKFRNIIQQNAINSGTQMILISAVYFKGNWKNKFDTQDTKNKTFNSGTKSYNVQMMSQEDYFNYKKLDDLGASYIELPYEGEKVSMIIILPDRGNSLENVEEKLTTVNLQDLRRNISTKSYVNLHLPKFKIENMINMENILRKMGLRSMFDSSGDFSNISPDGNIHVSQFMQKAYIEVSEKGTEAVAKNYFAITPFLMTQYPVKFHVDRPFHYKIIKHLDDEDVILFSGKVKKFEQ